MIVLRHRAHLDLHQRIVLGSRRLLSVSRDEERDVDMSAATVELDATPQSRAAAAHGATTLSIAIAGSGGSGVMTAGSLLLVAAE
jgi:hypothetical protein